jgi:predicted enzyme related to lactoylglutathione lyase
LAAPRVLRPNDIAAVRLVMQTPDVERIAEQALAAGATTVSTRLVTTPTGRRLLLRDPDGHLLELFSSNA